VRLVLSGQADARASLRAVPIAHQFLSKPCDARTLVEVVERACGLQALLGDAALRQTLGTISGLPSVPQTYHALVAALDDPDKSAKDVAMLVDRDVGLAAKVLQVASSGFFGVARRIKSVQGAVAYLGVETMKSIVLMTEAFGAFSKIKPIKGFSLDALQRHSVVVSSVARSLLANKQAADDAAMAGILHDVGKLVLATHVPERLAAAVKRSAEQGTRLHDAETALGGATHAEVGAYLLDLWGLPGPIVEAVANHHAPERVARSELGVLDAVHIANELVHEQEAAASRGPPPQAGLSEQFVESTGSGDKVAQWRQVVRETLARGEDDER
jgi:HD-like signal output (HDOD) protein